MVKVEGEQSVFVREQSAPDPRRARVQAKPLASASACKQTLSGPSWPVRSTFALELADWNSYMLCSHEFPSILDPLYTFVTVTFATTASVSNPTRP